MANNWPFSSVTAPNASAPTAVVEIGTGYTTLSAAAHRTAGLRVFNTLDSEQTVTVANGADVVLEAAKAIPAHDSKVIDLGFIQRTGLKIKSSISNGVFCEWEGWEGI